MRHHLASLLRTLADQLEYPQRSITISITGDANAARAAIADAELAIRRSAAAGRAEKSMRRWEGSA